MVGESTCVVRYDYFILRFMLNGAKMSEISPFGVSLFFYSCVPEDERRLSLYLSNIQMRLYLTEQKSGFLYEIVFESYE